MSEKTLRIVELLRKDARISKSKLAEELGITETAVRKRIRGLEERRIILGYRAVVDYRKLDMVQSFTGIDVEPEALLDVIRKLRDLDQVDVLYLTAGDHNLLAEIVCKSMEELEEVHRKISTIEGVRRICPAIVTEIVSIRRQ